MKSDENFRIEDIAEASVCEADTPLFEAAGNPEHPFIGRHLVVNYVNCDSKALRNLNGLRAAMERAAEASGATILQKVEHVFPPDGFTMLLLLSESHASIHTYPEVNSCFVDLFTCGTTCQAEKFDLVLRTYLKPRDGELKVFWRKNGVSEDRWKA